MRKLIPAAALVLLTAGCASVATKPATPATPATMSPATSKPATSAPTTPGMTTRQHVTYSRTYATGECSARDMGRLPDPRCTPGATDPRVTQTTIGQTICAKGWTTAIRPPASQTSHAKYQVAEPAYSVPAATVAELDHLVPLELGGSSDIRNLWPEAGTVPNAKDKVENRLHRDVCAGKITLTKARHAIAANWETAY